MTILIRGGTVIDADRTYRADVLCADPKDGGTILQIGLDLEVPAGTETIAQAGSTGRSGQTSRSLRIRRHRDRKKHGRRGPAELPGMAARFCHNSVLPFR